MASVQEDSGSFVERFLLRIEDYSNLYEQATREVFATSWLALAQEVIDENIDAALAYKWPLFPSKLALIDDEVVGFIQVRKLDLQRIYVLPSYTGLGVGKKLLEQAEALGARRLAVDEKNHRARAFYENNRWTWTGENEAGNMFPSTRVLIYRKLA